LRQLGIATNIYSTNFDDQYPAALGANCYALVHKFARHCGKWSLSNGADIPSFYTSVRPFVNEDSVYKSPVDQLDPVLASEGGHEPTWWEETKFGAEPGSSFEYTYWKSFDSVGPAKSRPAVLLYSLYAEDWTPPKAQQVFSVVRTDLSLSRLSSVALGQEVSP
jgi:hypothetical protein